jgi:hypothetical protein
MTRDERDLLIAVTHAIRELNLRMACIHIGLEDRDLNHLRDLVGRVEHYSKVHPGKRVFDSDLYNP